MKKAKNKAKQYVEKNPIEQILDIGTGIAQAGSDLAKSTINLDNWDEYLGLTEKKGKKRKISGNLKPGQELNLKDLQEEEAQNNERKVEVAPGIDYSREITHTAEISIRHENRELEMQLREIMTEIKKLTDSSKELQMQFKEVAVEQYVVAPGKYHKTFFSWLLSIIRAARMKIEDSGAWLAALQSKKKSRGYAAMAKKQGTSFTLNNERTVATQVG
jgi:hypothetical protein